MMMASIRRRGKLWYYTYVDENGRKVERRGFTDKRKTEEHAREIEVRVARIRDGLVDPRAERLAEAGRRQIGEHQEEFIATLSDKGRDPKHVRLTRTYIERVLDLGRIERVADLLPAAVSAALAALRADDL